MSMPSISQKERIIVPTGLGQHIEHLPPNCGMPRFVFFQTVFFHLQAETDAFTHSADDSVSAGAEARIIPIWRQFLGILLGQRYHRISSSKAFKTPK